MPCCCSGWSTSLLLIAAAEIGWLVRAHQIGMLSSRSRTRLPAAAHLRGRAADRAGRGRRLWRRRRSCRCASPPRGWRWRSSLGVIFLSLDLLPGAGADLLAIEPVLRDARRGGAAGRGARAARPGARRRDVQAPRRRARRGRARRADRARWREQPGINFVVAGFVAMGERRAGRRGRDPARRDPQPRRATSSTCARREVVLALEERRNALPLAGPAPRPDHGRARQRDLDLPRARDRPDRPQQRQSVAG